MIVSFAACAIFIPPVKSVGIKPIMKKVRIKPRGQSFPRSPLVMINISKLMAIIIAMMTNPNVKNIGISRIKLNPLVISVFPSDDVNIELNSISFQADFHAVKIPFANQYAPIANRCMNVAYITTNTRGAACKYVDHC